MRFEATSTEAAMAANGKIVNAVTPWHLIVDTDTETITIRKRNLIMIGVDEETYNYTVSGDTLTIIHTDDPTGPEYWTIKDLTKNELVIELTITYSYEVEGETYTDGHLVHYEFDRD